MKMTVHCSEANPHAQHEFHVLESVYDCPGVAMSPNEPPRPAAPTPPPEEKKREGASGFSLVFQLIDDQGLGFYEGNAILAIVEGNLPLAVTMLARAVERGRK